MQKAGLRGPKAEKPRAGRSLRGISKVKGSALPHTATPEFTEGRVSGGDFKVRNNPRTTV